MVCLGPLAAQFFQTPSLPVSIVSPRLCFAVCIIVRTALTVIVNLVPIRKTRPAPTVRRWQAVKGHIVYKRGGDVDCVCWTARKSNQVGESWNGSSHADSSCWIWDSCGQSTIPRTRADSNGCSRTSGYLLNDTVRGATADCAIYAAVSRGN